MEDHHLGRARREICDLADREVEQCPLVRLTQSRPPCGDLLRPLARDVTEEAIWVHGGGWPSELPQDLGGHVERICLGQLAQRRSGFTPLQQQRLPFCVLPKEEDGPVAAPMFESSTFLRALGFRLVQLQDCRAPVSEPHGSHEGDALWDEGSFHLERPGLHAFVTEPGEAFKPYCAPGLLRPPPETIRDLHDRRLTATLR